ncbi:conserved unknown protein [Ectocarpus siliculosus]|uniref:Plastid lipid-associated protein/fibrillin conserved domain-containing protein n=1 Tax=Ectocarpus siliculosus TaxID=2880 RepID=D7FPM9_ECTSI|nr:conserved unknown protein [Ectocarpus siliculosus]|eukprot:CBJ30486.1 conserved unknown protein [Ectocarpus siliculosus]
MVLRSLFLVALPISLNLGSAFLLPSVQQVVLPDTSTAIIRHQHDTGSRSMLSAAAPTAAGGSSSTATAKKSFLRNLERKRAGEEVASSALNADLHVLGSTPTQSSTTTVDNTRSWKGTWEICYAPHIQTLAKVILTEFPSVLYNFVSDDGRMVSHSRYESKVFGSGWFNADGRVVVLPASEGGTNEAPRQTVQVIFERFWWDRSGEDRPTGEPPGSSATPVDGFVQAAGKAMFFDGLSVFPVHYLDDDFCVFEFKAAGTVVASQRIA